MRHEEHEEHEEQHEGESAAADVTRSLLVLPTACGGTAYVLGVEHLSPSAAALVRQLVRGRRPQTVLLELDERRAAALGLPPLLAGSAAAAVEGAEVAAVKVAADGVVATISDAVGGGGGGGGGGDGDSGDLGIGDGPVEVRVAYPARGGFPGLPAVLFATLASSATGALSELYAGQRYGGELVAGALAAREVGARLVLADRDLALTLQRAAPELPLASGLALLPCALGGVHTAPRYSPPPRLLGALLLRAAARDWQGVGDALEHIALDSDAANEAFAASRAGRTLRAFNLQMAELVRRGRATRAGRRALGASLQRVLAAVESDPLLTRDVPAAIAAERDELLARAIRAAPGRCVVAVVGRGHLDGIARFWRGRAAGGGGGGGGGGRGGGGGGSGGADAVADAVADAAAVEALMQPPPFATARFVGAPLAAAAAAALAGRHLLRRSPAAFVFAAAVSCATAGSALVTAQRISEACERIRGALLAPDP